MNSFTLRLQDASRTEDIDGVLSFVGEDQSGSFGILAGHHRLMTVLKLGLARFRTDADNWQYLALPGAVLYFSDNRLTINTRHYLLDSDYRRISRDLQEQLLAEEEKLLSMKGSLHQLEEAVLNRLWELRRHG